MKTSAELQQQSLFRKLFYFGLILVLFSAMTFSGRVVRAVTGNAKGGWTVTERAEALQLREVSQGHANVLGATARVSLTGSRGFAICVLWIGAIEKQKKHEWNDLKMLVNVLTKLQPHFLTPWLFQSWNLAYNVSVESDRVSDKYFYISEGISLLAEGERINRARGIDEYGQPYEVGNPDMRFWIGFYYQNKFGASDEQNALRSMFQMACINPAKRNPADLRPGGKQAKVDLVRFQQFVKDNPYLCRRLRDFLRCARPEDVVDFLEDNARLPSRYEEVDSIWQLKPIYDQFPVLPNVELKPDRASPGSEFGGEFDNFYAAWAWHTFAQEPMPPFRVGVPAAGVPKYNPMRYRMNRQPAAIIFRQFPNRCQSFIAERLIREGWFDDRGWIVDETRVTDRWFPSARVVVGNDPRYSAQIAWELAHAMWKEHGEKHGLSLEQNKLDSLDARANRYRNAYGVDKFGLGEDLIEEQVDPEMWDSFDCHRQLIYYFQNLQLTNFGHFLYRSDAERDSRMIEARRLLFSAEEERKAASPDRAIARYNDGFQILCGNPATGRRGLLEDYPNFRHDRTLQEDFYEKHLDYLKLLHDRRGLAMRNSYTTVAMLDFGSRPLMGIGLAGIVAPSMYLASERPMDLPPLLTAPMDGRDSNGVPWVHEQMSTGMKMRMGLIKTPNQPPATPAPPPQGTGGPRP